MTARSSRRVSRWVLGIMAGVMLFCLVAGMFTLTQPFPGWGEVGADWSEEWRSGTGGRLTLPLSIETDGQAFALEKSLPAFLPRDVMVVVSSSYLPVAAQVGQQRLTVSGTFHGGAFGLTYANAYSVIFVPKECAGQILSLTLQPGGCKYRMELYQITMGNNAALKAQYLEAGESINLLGMFLIFAALILLIINLLLVLRGIREQSFELTMATLFIFLSAVWFLLDCGVNTIRFGQSPAFLFVNLFSYLMFGLPLQLLLTRICSTGKKWVAGSALASALLCLTVMGAALLGYFQLWPTLAASHILYTLMILTDGVCVTVEVFWKKNRALTGFLPGLLFLMLAGAATIYHFYFACSMDNASYYRTGVAAFSVGLTVWAAYRISGRILKAHTIKELHFAATHDELTGLYNRAAFCAQVRAMLAKNKNRRYAICCFDLVRFRLVNETSGRERGDQILRYLAGRLSARLKEEGVCGRLKSDKFLMCIPYTEREVQELCAGLQQDMTDFGGDIALTLDFGWAIVTDPAASVESLVDRAVSARSQIKGQYLNHIAFYDEGMRRLELYEQSLMNNAEEEMEAGRFLMYLQPKFDLRAGQINGMEALVRWRRGGGEMLSPGLFIPLFERCGLILRVDEYIWRRACQVLRRWIDLYGEESVVPISVNVSRVDVYSPNLCRLLISLVEEYRLPIRLLQLEITESACSEDVLQFARQIQLLRQKGFVIHMDDFGSGYSSLNMLRDLQVDVIKIDMRFLDDVEHSAKSRGILKAVVDMVRAMGIQMIAEGVETREQAQLLKSMGCDSVQGFYYSRPLPEDEAEKRLRSSRMAQEM